jgi:hypothetical protein
MGTIEAGGNASVMTSIARLIARQISPDMLSRVSIIHA